MRQEKRLNMFTLFRLTLYFIYVCMFFYMLPQQMEANKRFEIFTGVVLLVAMLAWVVPDIRKIIRS